MAAAIVVAYNDAIFQTLNLKEKYSHAQGLLSIFEEIGLDPPERTRLISDGLVTIEDMVNQYGYDIKSFYRYLENLNKTFATAANPADRVYYNPPAISMLCGALFYFNHCVHTLHALPDVSEATGQFLQENYDHYKSMVKESKDDDDDDIDIPKLKGHENWVKWRDAFTASLAHSFGARSIPLDYVVNQVPRDVTRSTAAMQEFLVINLEDDNLFTTCAVHFGPQFKTNSAKLWKS